MAQPMVTHSAPGTMRAWRRQEQSTPWRSHGVAVLARSPTVWTRPAPCSLSTHPRRRWRRGGRSGGGAALETTAIQARQRVRATQSGGPRCARPRRPSREQRRGAVPLCCALRVAAGVPFARTHRGQTCTDGEALPAGVGVQSALCAGLHGVHRACSITARRMPEPLGPWRASSCPVKSGCTGCRHMRVGSIKSRSSAARCNGTSSPRMICQGRWPWSNLSSTRLMSAIGIRNRCHGRTRRQSNT